MQIVINIDDEDYDNITLTGENTINLGVLLDLREAVRKGIALPKGHGRISDMDAAIKCIEDVEGEDALYAISLIEWACGKRTIIEADRSEEDG